MIVVGMAVIETFADQKLRAGGVGGNGEPKSIGSVFGHVLKQRGGEDHDFVPRWEEWLACDSRE